MHIAPCYVSPLSFADQSFFFYQGIIKLLNSCHRLTHLSLTGVPAFLREDLSHFCRNPPPEFTQHQRDVFCVFSGEGVSELREHLNNQPGYANYRDRQPVIAAIPTHHRTTVEYPAGPAQNAAAIGQMLNFDETEVDAPTDDDGLDETSDMVIDVPPAPAGGVGQATAIGVNNTNTIPIPPPVNVPHLLPGATPLPYMPGGYVQMVRPPENPQGVPQHLQQSNAQFAGAGHPVGPGPSVQAGSFPASDGFFEAGPFQQPNLFATSTASVAPVRVPSFQGDGFAGPSAGPSAALAQNQAHLWQMPAPIPASGFPGIVTTPTGASTASLTRPSSSQHDEHQPPAGGSSGSGVV